MVQPLLASPARLPLVDAEAVCGAAAVVSLGHLMWQLASAATLDVNVPVAVTAPVHAAAAPAASAHSLPALAAPRATVAVVVLAEPETLLLKSSMLMVVPLIALLVVGAAPDGSQQGPRALALARARHSSPQSLLPARHSPQGLRTKSAVEAVLESK